jgi:hypothetical protein
VACRYGRATPELAALPAWRDYCSYLPVGVYNNWFVARIDWWLSARVMAMQRAFDASQLIFTRRLNDLVFQSAIVLTQCRSSHCVQCL